MRRTVYKIVASYCIKFGENTKNIILQILRAISDGIIILAKCAVCGDRRLKFIKKQKAKGLLNNLVIRKILSKIPY